MAADDSVDGEDQEDSDEEDGEEDEEDEEMDEDEKDEDVEMDEKPKAHDPNDLSAFKMDEYDEESTGVGKSPHPGQDGADRSHGRIRKCQGSIILQGQQRGPLHHLERGKQQHKNPLMPERRRPRTRRT